MVAGSTCLAQTTNDGATLTIESGLNVYADYLTNENSGTINIAGNLIINSSLVNNAIINVDSGAALLQITGASLSGSGTFTVDRHIPGGVSFISSPINNETVNGFGISPTGSNGGQVIPNTSNPCNPDSIDITSDYGNLLELRENPISVLSNCAQSLWFVKSTGTLTNGRGYSLNNPSTTLTFGGTVNNGTVSYQNLTRQSGTIDQQDGSTSTRGWHLVGNPYPSPITLVGADLTSMGFDAQIQRYNDATGNWISNDPLISVTLPVGQGFQIRKTTVGGTADFELDNSFRTINSPDPFYRQQAPREHYLTMTLDNGSMADESMIYFYDGATDGFDALYDANRLMGKITNPHLYTVADDERLSYNAYALMQPEETKTVPVGVHSGVYGQFTLTFNDLNTLNAVVILEDTKLGTFTELTDGYVYTFTTVAGDANERFLLHFAQNKEEQPVGIDIITQEDIKLYPNPTSDNLTIELPKEHQYNQAIILNVAGQQVMNLDGVDDKTTLLLNTTKLSEGIYYIKLQGAYSTTLRFIKL